MPTYANQVRHKDQKQELDTSRVHSTIPKGAFNPPHQEGANSDNWVYPSEQMFYNAMKKKGWDPKEQEMSTIVKIHNAVNEQSWREVMRWESLHQNECANPTLVKFQGRPKDMSPKASFKSMMGYTAPFDRHDWIVDRCGVQVRYIIDFYRGPSTPEKPISIHLDVRPALDSFSSVYDRVVASCTGLPNFDQQKQQQSQQKKQ